MYFGVFARKYMLFRASLSPILCVVTPPLGDAPQAMNARKGMSDAAYATALEEATHIIKTAYWYVFTHSPLNPRVPSMR